MPSRRQFLSTSGLTLTVCLSGCLSTIGITKIGQVEEKAILLEWEYDGQRYIDDVLSIWGREDGLTGSFDPQFVGQTPQNPVNFVIDEAVHDALASRFRVKYLLGICGDDFSPCLNTWTSREDFNRVQLTDEAEVYAKPSWFDVIDVYESARSDVPNDVETYDFAELHRDDELPPSRN
ncbi:MULTISPECIES: hypothetical protein [unclassified Haladaptatus]|uniref:hypothetical protein n=1 Tax=unclassified Haladaptatus TaxID=2622732 RepID=UPI0023E77493|nr:MULTISPECIES: hypothetical protein [unclassified Haladaptatus]